MEFKDYYQVLGLERTATDEDIRKAYRRLARKYHPDVSKEADAESHMRDINEAREVLADPEKRAAYDQLAERYRAGQDFQPPPEWQQSHGFDRSGGFGSRNAGGPYSSSMAGDEFSDFFENLFGRGGWTREFESRGEDRHAKIFIDITDAYRGTSQVLKLQSRERTESGGFALREHQLTVRIPKGIKEGQHIRLKGKGSAGSHGEPGDLYLEVHFKPHPHFRVEGKDVFESVPITPWEAALGATVEVPTPSGPVKLTIPPGSQTGRKLRLKERGIPCAEPGDLYIELQVVVPHPATEQARQLYQAMAKEMNFNPREKMGAHP